MNQNSLTGEWRLADLTTNKNWVLELDELDQKEIMDATNISIESRKSLFDLKSLDFPLNRFIAKLEEAKHQLKNGLGFVLLRNLPVNQFSDKNIKIMFWGIGQYLGFPEPQDKALSLIHI